jgi:DNA repair exonuclease SbcCD ATPase subunit
MLSRILLIVAIVAGLAAAGLNFTKVKEKITTLQDNLTSETAAKTEAQQAEAAAKKAEALAKKDLEETKTQLATTTEERDKAASDRDAQTKRADRTAEELTKTKTDLADTQAEIAAWKALGLSLDQIRGMKADFNGLTSERNQLAEAKRKLEKEIASLNNRLQKYEGEDSPVVLPNELHGRVLVADPKWDFVVLDVGENQGVKENGVLLVNRNGKLVARVQVRSMQGDRCIANVLPGRLGEVMEGDLVIP